MPKFSKKSKLNLSSCRTELIFLFESVVKIYDCSIFDGHRNKEAQNAYFNSGNSEERWPDSKHNETPSSAVDAGPYINGGIPWQDHQQFSHFAGFVLGMAHILQIPLIWGGDWNSNHDLNDQKFNDLCHFELTGE